MQRIQHIARSIMIVVLLCAGIFICVNDPGFNARTMPGWNMTMNGNSEVSRHAGWRITHRGMSISANGVANAALNFEEPQRIVRK